MSVAWNSAHDFIIFPWNRTSRNPYDVKRYTGGSSSGPAAIVSSGLCPVALGTDVGGVWETPILNCTEKVFGAVLGTCGWLFVNTIWSCFQWLLFLIDNFCVAHKLLEKKITMTVTISRACYIMKVYVMAKTWDTRKESLSYMHVMI